MTNSERIAANNTRLSALVETAESLPDAGVGGGASVETCNVTIAISSGATVSAETMFSWTTLGDDGAMETKSKMYLAPSYVTPGSGSSGDITLTCVKGTAIHLSFVSKKAKVVTPSSYTFITSGGIYGKGSTSTAASAIVITPDSDGTITYTIS